MPVPWGVRLWQKAPGSHWDLVGRAGGAAPRAALAHYGMARKRVGRGKSKKIQPEMEPGCLPKVLTQDFFSIIQSGCNRGSFLNLDEEIIHD